MSFSIEDDVGEQIRRYAKERGAIVTDLGSGHFQIRGSLLVNYYPLSRRKTAYVASTKRGRYNVTPEEAVNIAFVAPPIATGPRDKDRRHGKSRQQRRRLFRVSGPHCHWCRKLLTIDTSTIEHKIPLARGGLDNANNRVLSCGPCNWTRSHNMPELDHAAQHPVPEPGGQEAV